MDVDLWIVQPDPTEPELGILGSGRARVAVPAFDVVDDFENLAAFFVCMDAVISPFTTTAELAGALGVPTFMLSTTHITAWRRGPDGADFWHRSARVVVGASAGDRASVIRSLESELRALIEGPG